MPDVLASQRGELSLSAVEREDIPFLSQAHAVPEYRYRHGFEVKNQGQLEYEFENQSGFDESFIACLEKDDPQAGISGRRQC